MEENKERIIQTDQGREHGQTKCPKCGSTEIALNPKTGKLCCLFCRNEFEPEKFEELETDIEHLEGEIIGSGAADIQADADDQIVTLKCSSCGAEVVIDSNTQTQARCHWCRNILSLNKQIRNGAVPDAVLPFKVNKKEAKECIEQFVGKRQLFAHPKFKEEFTADNVMGVYLPYMVIDANAHASFGGQGEIESRQYTRKENDKEKTYYDAKLYNVGREFDLAVEGLTVESSQDKLDVHSRERTNNIINSIMPFDTENCVRWNANYLHGYTSEKRDVNVEQLSPVVQKQCEEIAKDRVNETISQYDRGVRWDSRNLVFKGRQWKSAYLPVWLYSFQEEKNDQKIIHYVAVNARTRETMGSIPIYKPKLLLFSAAIELVGLIAALILHFTVFDQGQWYPWLLLLPGFIYYLVIHNKYRNSAAVHHYVKETKCNVSNLEKQDTFVKERTGLDSPAMEGANNR